MTRVCSLPMKRCVNEDDERWRMGYVRRIGAACALLCGSSAAIGTLTCIGGAAAECLLPTVLLAGTAAVGLAAAANPALARRIADRVSRE